MELTEKVVWLTFAFIFNDLSPTEYQIIYDKNFNVGRGNCKRRIFRKIKNLFTRHLVSEKKFLTLVIFYFF